MPTRPTDPTRARASAGLPPPSNGKELTPFQEAQKTRISEVERMIPAFADAIRDEATAKRLARDAITALRTTPDLVKCTQASFLGSLMTAAQLDLRPNVAAVGQCWLVPFKNGELSRKAGQDVYEAQFILGYRGMVTLGHRSGVALRARHIYTKEQYVIEYGLDERLIHTPILDPTERGDYLYHYAIATTSSEHRMWHVMADSEVRAVRDTSQGYRFGGSSNPWRTNYGPMALKTPARRLFPWLPIDSPELAYGVAADGQVRTDMDPAELERMTPVDEEPDFTAEPDSTKHFEVDQPEGKPARKASVKRVTAEAERAAANRADMLQMGREKHREGWPAALRLVSENPDITEDTATDEQVSRAIQLSPEAVAAWQEDEAAQPGPTDSGDDSSPAH